MFELQTASDRRSACEDYRTAAQLCITEPESKMRNDSVLEIEFEYALRMVRSGFAPAAVAAQICGIPLPALETRLHEPERTSSVVVRPSALKGFWERV
jgi:hypothetical protein